MARIAGVDLPRDKKIAYALPYIYGIGPCNVHDVLKRAEVNGDVRTKDLTDDDVVRLSKVIASEYVVEGDLRREVSQNIKRLMDIGCYRGLRHRRSLPCRGQNTKNNTRTRKGRRKTVANKKK